MTTGAENYFDERMKDPAYRSAYERARERVLGSWEGDVGSWDDGDMYEAWAAGANWAINGVEIEDGELFIPTDEPGVIGRDWWDEFGHWIADYEAKKR